MIGCCLVIPAGRAVYLGSGEESGWDVIAPSPYMVHTYSMCCEKYVRCR